MAEPIALSMLIFTVAMVVCIIVILLLLRLWRC